MATDRVNDMVKTQLLSDVQKAAPRGSKVLILGIAYRPNTWLTEESAGLALAQGLHRSGRQVWIHDPLATPENSPAIREFNVAGDWKKALRSGRWSAVVICNPCREYAGVKASRRVRLFDPWSIGG